MSRSVRLGPVLFVAGAAALAAMPACLGPQVSDDLDLDRIFGDPNIPPDQVLHVQDNPDLRAKVAQFPTSVPYLQGYAKGQKIWYWHVAGISPDHIVPYYVVIDSAGQEQRPIIDVLPGDAGYSPWWRKFEVRQTAKYAGERIWSRAAIDAGVKAGILEAPLETEKVATCVVVDRGVRVQVRPKMRPEDPVEEASPYFVWYRSQRVSWVQFQSTIDVPLGVRHMPAAPQYVLQRVNETMPLYESATGIDLDGNKQLINSNNIFAMRNGDPGYTPMWYAVRVRTVPEYISIDTSSTAVPGLDDEADFVGPSYDVVVSDLVVPPLMIERDALEVCPIQTAFSEL